MPMPTQFALSLELSKLIPLSVTAAEGSYQAAMKLARDIQGSGSSAIIEEDLLEVFGRVRIDSNFSSSFRAVLSQPKENGIQNLQKQLGLYYGPGPSVHRAMKHPAYMALLIQCSLLSSTHGRHSLASNISKIFEKRSEGAPLDHLTTSFPNVTDIQGYLRACEDQTAAYEWSLQLRAVAYKIGIPESRAFEELPSVLLCSLPDLAPWVQYWPETNLITVKVGRGICMLILWMHTILGLPLCVTVHRETDQKYQVLFGNSPEAVVVEFYEGGVVPSITLLSQSNPEEKKEKITFRGEPEDDIELTADPHVPTQGYGIAVLSLILKGNGKVPKKLVTGFASMCFAFAIIISDNISMIVGGTDRLPHTPSNMSPTESMVEEYTNSPPPISKWEGYEDVYFKIPRHKIAKAIAVLFDGELLTQEHTREYESVFSGERLSWIKEPPAMLRPQLDKEKNQHLWRDLRNAALRLSQLALAFSYVQETDDYSQLPLGLNRFPMNSDLAHEIHIWKGEGPIRITGDAWFKAIAQAMAGVSSPWEDFESGTAVVSERGWSLFQNTFGDPDPGLIDCGSLAVRRGVPWIRGIWKHRVIDAPSSDGSITFAQGAPLRAGRPIQLRCSVPMKFGPLLCGEAGDAFIVSRKIFLSDTSVLASATTTHENFTNLPVMRVGYGSLFLAAFLIKKTDVCEHGESATDRILLDHGCVAFHGIPATPDNEFDQFLTIYLTAKDKVARWATIEACHRDKAIESDESIMVRIPGCCIRCAIYQAQAEDTVRKLVL